MLKGHNGFEVVLTWGTSDLAILKRDPQSFRPLKKRGGGDKRFDPVLKGREGKNKCRTRDFPIL